jgi:hypothetical protein
MSSDIQEKLVENWGDDLLIMDGYDDCIVGVCERFGSEPHVIYDLKKILNKLIESGMSPEEAEEYYQFNMVGSYVGEHTPAFLSRL